MEDSCPAVLWRLFDPECAAYFLQASQNTPFDLLQYVKVFGSTLILELPFYLLALRGVQRLGRRLEVWTAANLLTHPMVYFGLPMLFAYFAGSYRAMLLTAEVFAPLAEMAFCRWAGVSWRRTLWILAANLFSWHVGAWFAI